MAQRRVVYRGTNVRVEFLPDRRSIARCAVGPEVRAAVRDLAANKAKPYAVSISPRSSRHHRHYADGFRVEMGHVTLPPEWPMRRVAAILVNTVEHAVIVELGANRTPAYRVLARTLAYLNGGVVGRAGADRKGPARP